MATPVQLRGVLRRHGPREFALEIALAPTEVIEQLCAHPAVHDADEPLGGDGDPGFETVALSAREIRLRARPRPLDSRESLAVSPTMVVTLRGQPWGTQVRGRLVRASNRAESAMELTRTTLVLLLVAGLLTTCGLIAWPGLAIEGAVAYAVASALSLVVSLRMLTSPWREGMREYGPSLRALVGELLVPHALPGEVPTVDPFRLDELGRRRADAESGR